MAAWPKAAANWLQFEGDVADRMPVRDGGVLLIVRAAP
jgi:hypothetical protein